MRRASSAPTNNIARKERATRKSETLNGPRPLKGKRSPEEGSIKRKKKSPEQNQLGEPGKQRKA